MVSMYWHLVMLSKNNKLEKHHNCSEIKKKINHCIQIENKNFQECLILSGEYDKCINNYNKCKNNYDK